MEQYYKCDWDPTEAGGASLPCKRSDMGNRKP